MRCHEIPSGRTTMDTASLDSWLPDARVSRSLRAWGFGYTHRASRCGAGSIPRRARLFMGSQWIYLTSLILPRGVDNVNNRYVE